MAFMGPAMKCNTQLPICGSCQIANVAFADKRFCPLCRSPGPFVTKEQLIPTDMNLLDAACEMAARGISVPIQTSTLKALEDTNAP